MPHLLVPHPRCRADIIRRLAAEWHPAMADIVADRTATDGDAILLREWLQDHGYISGQDFHIEQAPPE